MARHDDDRILIAGGGPAGLAAALFLDDEGIDVEVVDPRERPDDDERAVVLRRDTVGRLASVGVVFDVGREARLVDMIAVYEGPGWQDAERLDPREADGIVLPQYVLCKRLDEALRARDVKVRWSHRLARLEVVDHHVVAELEGLGVDTAGYATMVHERIVETTSRREPPYLIAADGAESIVRNQLRIPWRPLGAPKRVASFELVTDGDPGGSAHLVVGDVTIELWPMAGDAVALFAIGGDTPLHDPPDLDDALALIDEFAPTLGPSILSVRRARALTVAPGFAEPWHVGPVWLLGGAARVLPAPAYAADRSVRDARRLAAAFGRAVRTLEPPERIVDAGL